MPPEATGEKSDKAEDRFFVAGAVVWRAVRSAGL